MNMIKFKAIVGYYPKHRYRIKVLEPFGSRGWQLVAEPMQGFPRPVILYTPKVYDAAKMEAARKKYQKALEETGCAYTDADRKGLG